MNTSAYHTLVNKLCHDRKIVWARRFALMYSYAPFTCKPHMQDRELLVLTGMNDGEVTAACGQADVMREYCEQLNIEAARLLMLEDT